MIADVRVRHIQALVEDPGGDEGSETSLAEGVEHRVALGAADVTGQGHDEVLPRDGIGAGVVGGEHEYARVAVTGEERLHGPALCVSQGQELPCFAQAARARRPSAVRAAARTTSGHVARGTARKSAASVVVKAWLRGAYRVRSASVRSRWRTTVS